MSEQRGGNPSNNEEIKQMITKIRQLETNIVDSKITTNNVFDKLNKNMRDNNQLMAQSL